MFHDINDPKEICVKKSVLISGCSSGIGQAVAKRLAKKDFLVYAAVRNNTDLEAISLLSENIHALILDITKPEDIEAAYKLISETSGSLDILINNAGIACGGPVEASKTEQWKEVFDVNLFGTVALTKTMLPLIRKSSGQILNISSVSGLVAAPFMSIYAASKFALEAFSDSLRREITPMGIKVSVIEPGPTKTKIWEKGLGKSREDIDNIDSQIKDQYKSAIKNFEAVIEEAISESVNVDKVAKVIEQACTTDKPKTRYIISSKKNLIKLLRIIPDKVSDKLILTARK